MSALKELRELWEFFVWQVRAAWAIATNRWHFLRDAPDHVVFKFAAWADAKDPAVQLLIDEARGEAALRLRVLENQVRAAVAAKERE